MRSCTNETLQGITPSPTLSLLSHLQSTAWTSSDALHPFQPLISMVGMLPYQAYSHDNTDKSNAIGTVPHTDRSFCLKLPMTGSKLFASSPVHPNLSLSRLAVLGSPHLSSNILPRQTWSSSRAKTCCGAACCNWDQSPSVPYQSQRSRSVWTPHLLTVELELPSCHNNSQ